MTENWLSLPFPPSVNAMYRNVSGKGRVKSADYKKWEKQAGFLILEAKPRPHTGPVRISYTFGAKSGRWDMSNFIKAIEDLLVTHGLIEDDSAKIIKRFTVTQNPNLEGVLVRVTGGGIKEGEHDP
ncbi:RusA family crossover junction endodeoxyribonuclease [Roseibium sp. RKSG952]|uniref:RusA family crossover junction endodeoxyribonuclease n=1 Tax=Roseibium sp. RKSG952 TaxID=2529384 RepID=UPI0012BBF52C|nr:RusA family crossover junction endodeoxyribonuclease [Roseibium sp. RKSG952]MTH96559.1 RusA family crossover junction endodeoxyribonuclease [Roseibium sp. RKSG952]